MNINDAYLWLKSISGVTNNTIDKIELNNINLKDLINFSNNEIYNLKNIKYEDIKRCGCASSAYTK